MQVGQHGSPGMPYPLGVAKTADYTVTAADSGRILTNSGSSAEVTFTLPRVNTLAGPVVYEFLNVNTYGIKITPNAADSIAVAGFTGMAGGSLERNVGAVGGMIRIVSVGTSQWSVEHVYSIWTLALTATASISVGPDALQYGNGSDGEILYSVANARWEDGAGAALTSGAKWTVSGATLSLIGPRQFTNVTVNNGGTLLSCPDGYEWTGFHSVRGTLTVAVGGTLRAGLMHGPKSGGAVITGAAAVTASGAGTAADVTPYLLGMGGKIGSSAAGGGDGVHNGGNGCTTTGSKTYMSLNAYVATPSSTPAGGKGPGSSGGSPNDWSGYLYSDPSILRPGYPGLGGGGGALALAGSRTNSRGGAGGDGGRGSSVLAFKAYKIVNAGSITANGENGSAGQDAVASDNVGDIGGGGGGGSGGGSGSLILLYGSGGYTNTGTVTCVGGSGGTGGLGKAYTAAENTYTAWASGTAYALGVFRRASTTQGVVFVCSVAGTSGGSEPTWSATPGALTVDGGVTWVATLVSTSNATCAAFSGGVGGGSSSNVGILYIAQVLP